METMRLITPIGFTGSVLGLDDDLLLHILAPRFLFVVVATRTSIYYLDIYIHVPLFSVTRITLTVVTRYTSSIRVIDSIIKSIPTKEVCCV